MTEREFEKIFKAQHKDLRSHNRDQFLATKELILSEGFKDSFNVNAMPIFRRKMNDLSDRFANRKGDFVYLLEKEGFKNGPNGYQTKQGYKPRHDAVIEIEYDFQPSYEAYTNQFKTNTMDNKSEEQILAEIQAKIKESCTKSRYVNLCQRLTTDGGLAYVTNRCIDLMSKDKIHLSAALAQLEAEQEGID